MMKLAKKDLVLGICLGISREALNGIGGGRLDIKKGDGFLQIHHPVLLAQVMWAHAPIDPQLSPLYTPERKNQLYIHKLLRHALVGCLLAIRIRLQAPKPYWQAMHSS